MTFAKPEKDSYRGGKVGGDDAPPLDADGEIPEYVLVEEVV